MRNNSLGLDESLEGEELDTGNQVGSGDKADLQLPQVQQELLEKVLEVGKPTIVIVMAGSSLDLSYPEEHANAIIQAWYPGAEGGAALAELIFGLSSPSGKLPITFYRDLEDMPEFGDYSMKNRTYRYLQKTPLYPFGYGLSYGKAMVKEARFAIEEQPDSKIIIKAIIVNESHWELEEVVQVYVKDEESGLAVPNHSLCAFKRVSLKPAERKMISMEVNPRALTVVDEQGERAIRSRKFTLYIGTSQPDQRSVELTGTEPVKLELLINKNMESIFGN